MNFLSDELPETVFVENIEFSINFQAGTLLKINEIVETSKGDDYENIAKQLELFYPVMPIDVVGAYQKLIEFYTYDVSNITHISEGRINSRRHTSLYDDASLIYAAFKQTYGNINVRELHWFEFKALLETLPEDTLYSKVVSWRQMVIDSKMSNEEKKFYRKMKQIYKLPDRRTQEEKDAEFARLLFYG